jgi:hypothetical protein
LNSVAIGDRGEWAVGGGEFDSISVRRCNSPITTTIPGAAAPS